MRARNNDTVYENRFFLIFAINAFVDVLSHEMSTQQFMAFPHFPFALTYSRNMHLSCRQYYEFSNRLQFKG